MANYYQFVLKATLSISLSSTSPSLSPPSVLPSSGHRQDAFKAWLCWDKWVKLLKSSLVVWAFHPFQQHLHHFFWAWLSREPLCWSSVAAPSAKGMAWTAGRVARYRVATAISSGFAGRFTSEQTSFGLCHCGGWGGTPRFFKGLDPHQVYISLQAQASLLVSVMSQYWVVHQVLRLPGLELLLATVAKLNSCLVTLGFTPVYQEQESLLTSR